MAGTESDPTLLAPVSPIDSRVSEHLRSTAAPFPAVIQSASLNPFAFGPRLGDGGHFAQVVATPHAECFPGAGIDALGWPTAAGDDPGEDLTQGNDPCLFAGFLPSGGDSRN